MTEFNKPTAQALIVFLQTLPPETLFVIADPDTGWRIDMFSIEHDAVFHEAIVMAAYEDMNPSGLDRKGQTDA